MAEPHAALSGTRPSHAVTPLRRHPTGDPPRGDLRRRPHSSLRNTRFMSRKRPEWLMVSIRGSEGGQFSTQESTMTWIQAYPTPR
jgi:hypothetical protein